MRLLFATFLFVACATPAEKPAEPASPAPSPARAAPALPDEPPLPFLASCREACNQRNARRAVAASMIDAECTGECVGAWRAPIATSAAELAKLVGQQARVVGVLAVEGKLTLRDGRVIEVLPGLAELPPPAPSELVVIAHVEKPEQLVGVIAVWSLAD